MVLYQQFQAAGQAVRAHSIGRTDGRMDEWMDEPMDEPMDGWMDLAFQRGAGLQAELDRMLMS